jgi:hypothetical protein
MGERENIWRSRLGHVGSNVFRDVGIIRVNCRGELTEIRVDGFPETVQKVLLTLFVHTPNGPKLPESIIAGGNFRQELGDNHGPKGEPLYNRSHILLADFRRDETTHFKQKHN